MDIRRQRTRALLVQAFEELSRTKALQEISVSEICELATVRRGTFYKHFEDKDDFFRYYLTTVTADIVNSSRRVKASMIFGSTRATCTYPLRRC
ncbi:MAG: TetR family transcriptional regulator [Eggerthellaceae bacterium]|nr:TetR family transcriptional regulator [Eggerthellaceae bacterium]